MSAVKLNKGFRIPKEVLDERLGLKTQIPADYHVIPLRGLESVECLVPLTVAEVNAHIQNIPLEKSHDVFPFKTAQIARHMSGPHGLHVPQTFIMRSKLISLLEGLDDLYTGFSFPSLAQRTAHYVIGKDSDGRPVAGVYVPPLVEIINGGNEALLFDGNHRMALAAVGAPMETLLIKGATVKPPYSGVPWHRNFVDVKPPVEKRYNNFDSSLFKDFGYVGIDG